ncbi:endopolyphosphatase [Saccharomycopsis crataegensis]|uniref:Endopolyphosphatase n=1 Tax=Saccharomycopsis crataegensis TaxID=43959 RepID=A0AAV5QT34_9ASCO|nr:endopolyphosphatase [Saccharomycopsis crataegensis]
MVSSNGRSLGWLLLLPVFMALIYLKSPGNYDSNHKPIITQSSSSPVKIIDNSARAEEYESLGLTNSPSIEIELPNNMRKTIHGRFLHITDMHPDFFYKESTSIGTACHSGHGNASFYGDAMMGCDSPYALVKETLDWIEANLKDKIDFVIWTGDNVRHDNDRAYPRTEDQIFDVNENISSLMTLKFKGEDSLDPRAFQVPLVPSLGNNDVYPHNLFALGPTLQSRLLYRTWSSYIPQDQAHVFEKTACFLSEVIPGKLAVLSINTLYLFKSNPLVDNCDKKKQPGYTLFVWLGYTLKELRRRGMKVWLSGHVPPVPKNFDITCYRKYILWLYEYRDIIIGGVYGHMNLDHFVPLDAVAAYQSLKKDTPMPGFQDLVSAFQELDEDDEDGYISLTELYSAFGIDDSHGAAAAKLSSELHALGASPGSNKVSYMDTVNDIFYSSVISSSQGVSQESDKKNNKKDKKKKNKKKKKKEYNDGTRYSVIHVAGSVIPTFNPAFRVWEYNVTNFAEEAANIHTASFEPWDDFFYGLERKIDAIVGSEEDEYTQEYLEIFSLRNGFGAKSDKSLPPKMPSGTGLGPAFVPQTFTPTKFSQFYLDLEAVNSGKKEFRYEVEYTSESEPYSMKSLLANDWVELARELAKKKKAWNTYLHRTFVSTNYEEIRA